MPRFHRPWPEAHIAGLANPDPPPWWFESADRAMARKPSMLTRTPLGLRTATPRTRRLCAAGPPASTPMFAS